MSSVECVEADYLYILLPEDSDLLVALVTVHHMVQPEHKFNYHLQRNTALEFRNTMLTVENPHWAFLCH